MSAITIFFTALLAEAVKKPGTNIRFEEEPHLIVLIYLVFAGIIAAGGVISLNGIWMLIFGRRNMFLFYIFIALLIAAYIAGRIFTGIAQ